MLCFYEISIFKVKYFQLIWEIFMKRSNSFLHFLHLFLYLFLFLLYKYDAVELTQNIVLQKPWLQHFARTKAFRMCQTLQAVTRRLHLSFTQIMNTVIEDSSCLLLKLLIILVRWILNKHFNFFSGPVWIRLLFGDKSKSLTNF